MKQGADGIPVAGICRTAGISQATCFSWKKYDGLLPTEMKRLKPREEVSRKPATSRGDLRDFAFRRNGKPKKLVVDLSLDRATLQDVLARKL